MSHATAALTPQARIAAGASDRRARLVTRTSSRTLRRARAHRRQWADRYRTEGSADMQDHSSRPRRQPTRTPAPDVRKILYLRRQRRWAQSR